MTTTESERAPAPVAPKGIEANGINVIDESERRGTPAGLFWPWCASNISVLAVSYGAFVLGFGIGLWQALLATVVGAVVSFFLVGLVSIAGKRGSAPTLVLSRAAFGKNGNILPGLISYVLLVGWETVLVALSTLATATVFDRLGWAHGDTTKIAAFVVVALVIVLAGILGFDTIMRMQKVLTVSLIVVTAVYIALTVDHVHLDTLRALPNGDRQAVIGATILVLTGFGLGWVNTGADYSRYLPRRTSTSGVVWWPTIGGSLPVVLLVGYGVLLAGSDQKLSSAVGADPIGALTTILPTWFLLPFAIVAVAGLVSGAVMDIYSSGLTLLTLGLRTPRWVAAGIDGVLMIAGAIYIVFYSSSSFIYLFEAYLIFLGVPMAAWCGVFLADLLLRRRDYDEPSLYTSTGIYGSFRLSAVLFLALGTAAGWGLVIVTTGQSKGLTWLGYLMDGVTINGHTYFDLGGTAGSWAYANVGVPVALVIGFVGYLLFGFAGVRRQERDLRRTGTTTPEAVSVD
ncbi:purine-cytosine permease family protein [Nocardioides cynanchi]|uniref:purine-cytosine permease family protein n=1 Tax=Nocardioides cynanchi TaxID=2558918 RepID=UPI0012447749|nr:cytosine permease [Nocardioides cynanchi]